MRTTWGYLPNKFIVALAFALIAVIADDDLQVAAQTTSAAPSPAITVSIALQNEKVIVGQSPWVGLLIKNETDREIEISDYMVKLHVEGAKGELPRIPNSEVITRRIDSRVARLKPAVYVPWTIGPGDSSLHRYDLAHFFNLKDPGQYTVYMETMDLSSRKWLRTNTASFEMKRPDK